MFTGSGLGSQFYLFVSAYARNLELYQEQEDRRLEFGPANQKSAEIQPRNTQDVQMQFLAGGARGRLLFFARRKRVRIRASLDRDPPAACWAGKGGHLGSLAALLGKPWFLASGIQRPEQRPAANPAR
ncbi:hypothetical protein VTN77DRAFT_6138 [Rasamsonia byssochlamydoides]|uniref:uncharacterized protein n=1 Tax=Rasamsonia byssochlamydoides TaxID=89139 RepID=UPI0037428760